MEWFKSLIAATPKPSSARVASELEAETQKVKRVMLSTFLFGLEQRDHELEIFDHCAQVSIIAEKLGSRMGISEADAYVLQSAARTHEMGMIAVSPELLNREGSLTDSEIETVRSHSVLSASMTLSMHNPRVALLIKNQYADYIGLKKTLSPGDLLLAGILRVADAIAAMTWPRPYQTALTPELQVEALEIGSGVRYHPEAARFGAQLRGGVGVHLAPAT